MTQPAGRVALVTGASQGIGAATAQAFGAAGWSVVLAARGAEKLAAVAAGLGPDAVAIPTDVTDPQSVEALFAAVRDRFGRVDAVFNNAGANSKTRLAGDVTWEEWRHVVSVNLDGAFLIASAAFRAMRDQDPQGGRIINNGSIAAQVPRVGGLAYATTKHAVSGLTKSLEIDGRGLGIRCTQIDIGNASTAMTARMGEGIAQPDGSRRVEPTFDPGHVGELVRYVVELPLDVTMPFATVAAAEMPWLARG